jgi:hypothetical protein
MAYRLLSFVRYLALAPWMSSFATMRGLFGAFHDFCQGVDRTWIAGLTEPKNRLFADLGIGVISGNLAQGGDALVLGPLGDGEDRLLL